MRLVSEHKTRRFKLLLALYIAADADTEFSINMEVLAEQRQIEFNKMEKALRYLLDEHFVELRDGGGEMQVSITHKGLKVVEEAFLDPKKQTYYFPPYQEMRKKD